MSLRSDGKRHVTVVRRIDRIRSSCGNTPKDKRDIPRASKMAKKKAFFVI